MLDRLRLAWLILTGRVAFSMSIERLIFMTDLTKTNAALASLNISADRLIAKSQADDATVAAANQTVADADDAVSTQVAAVTAKIDAVVPAVAAVDPVVEQPSD